MEKLKVQFVVKASTEDPKSNIMCITSITDTDNHTFLIPERYQPVKLHDEIKNTVIYQKIRETLQKRHEKRAVWIKITPELRNVYMDEDGNMQFKGYLLEETTLDEPQKNPSAGISEEALARILENFASKKDTFKQENIKILTEKFVLEKFSSKTTNASQWMNTFEAECSRLGINEDVKKIEALRLFLEVSCHDWYSSMLIKHTVISEWSVWKKSFCETYADKGWTPVRYAISFKYRQGSLLEYALKKERLLLEINKSMDKCTLINLIATGLPNFVSDKIDRNDLNATEDLFNSIRGLEHLVNKKNWEKKENIYSKIKDNNHKPACKICEKENKGIRYHPESLCWYKNKNSDRGKKDQIRSVNNSELETELNEMDPKNL